MAEIILEKQQEPARLRIYIGAAPGVGKTYSMLNDAHLMMHQQAVDVVIGLVEPHGRKETEALIRDLEIIPQKVIPYRGVQLKEMDVEAILARHPNTVVVDELAHTNAPGSRNTKRFQDTEELIRAGINVISTLNIQHVESLDGMADVDNLRLGQNVQNDALHDAHKMVVRAEVCGKRDYGTMSQDYSSKGTEFSRRIESNCCWAPQSRHVGNEEGEVRDREEGSVATHHWPVRFSLTTDH